MVVQVILDEAGDEAIAVVVSLLNAQPQRNAHRLGCLDQGGGPKLLVKKGISRTLIHQKRGVLTPTRGAGALPHQ